MVFLFFFTTANIVHKHLFMCSLYVFIRIRKKSVMLDHFYTHTHNKATPNLFYGQWQKADFFFFFSVAFITVSPRTRRWTLFSISVQCAFIVPVTPALILFILYCEFSHTENIFPAPIRLEILFSNYPTTVNRESYVCVFVCVHVQRLYTPQWKTLFCTWTAVYTFATGIFCSDALWFGFCISESSR